MTGCLGWDYTPENEGVRPKRDHLKGNESSSNHHFSGDMLIFRGLFEVQGHYHFSGDMLIFRGLFEVQGHWLFFSAHFLTQNTLHQVTLGPSFSLKKQKKLR